MESGRRVSPPRCEASVEDCNGDGCVCACVCVCVRACVRVRVHVCLSVGGRQLHQSSVRRHLPPSHLQEKVAEVLWGEGGRLDELAEV